MCFYIVSVEITMKQKTGIILIAAKCFCVFISAKKDFNFPVRIISCNNHEFYVCILLQLCIYVPTMYDQRCSSHCSNKNFYGQFEK